jgi:hypothetical protein
MMGLLVVQYLNSEPSCPLYILHQNQLKNRLSLCIQLDDGFCFNGGVEESSTVCQQLKSAILLLLEVTTVIT